MLKVFEWKELKKKRENTAETITEGPTFVSTSLKAD